MIFLMLEKRAAARVESKMDAGINTRRLPPAEARAMMGTTSGDGWKKRKGR
ncbi:hypothetical protein [Saccharibacillus alkalitolerans]|uniref:Uncharacterized protein n=1 Tax=Saccharibacillus alkalitolerans TaxID=2705290 RepID=A0ABX0FB85_9BACL|nr:hypothetical protein [Saccharibacillus alkalitolerans]NGZ77214.1 hypothetical protein [Saccharibacillus alkalitolerans]